MLLTRWRSHVAIEARRQRIIPSNVGFGVNFSIHMSSHVGQVKIGLAHTGDGTGHHLSYGGLPVLSLFPFLLSPSINTMNQISRVQISVSDNTVDDNTC